MAGGRIVVHDVDVLEDYLEFLREKREELEDLFKVLESETEDQGDNWQDPQYDYLKDKVEAYCKECNRQLDVFDESLEYIEKLIDKIKDI